MTEPTNDWVTIHIEGKPFRADKSQNLLHACLALGFDIPHFCWHPALGSMGACRLCAVKRFRDDQDTQGEIIMSCMTPVSEGLSISIHDPEAAEFRAAVIGWLMINHPHDCPVCDEGGECHLQDMTVMTGHAAREYRFKKRTHRNQDLGPFINHEMNRCIQCYRCVRFYRNIAGGRDLNVFGAHDHLYFGRHENGTLENPFSGNLVEICPTGTFTDKTQKAHNTRSWDLQTAPSVCVHCGLGCNTLPGERYGLLRRMRNRFNSDINGYFLCDRGRFGYEFVNSLRRIRTPLFRTGKESPQVSTDMNQALSSAVGILSNKDRVIGIGSPRASLEANTALRSLVGKDRFHAGFSETENRLMTLIVQIMSDGPVKTGTLKEAAMADAVLVLGEDVTVTAPRLALALRQTVFSHAVRCAERVHLPAWDDVGVREVAQDDKGHLFIATSQPTDLDDAARSCFRGTPDEIVAFGFDVHARLNKARKNQEDLAEPDGMYHSVVTAFQNARRPVVIAGLSSGSEAMIKAAANIARNLAEQGKDVRLIFCVPECNSMGLALLNGKSLESAIDAVNRNLADTVIVLENDLFRRTTSQNAEFFLQKARRVIVLDHLQTRTTAMADLVLPVSTFSEGNGTLVNNEGRAQTYYGVIAPDNSLMESFRVLNRFNGSGPDDPSTSRNRDAVLQDLAEDLPVFAPLAEPHAPLAFPVPSGKVPRQSFGYSGRTAMNAHVSVHEPRPPEDPDSLLAFSMEGFDGSAPSDLVTRFQAPGWNSVQAVFKHQTEPGGPLLEESSGRCLLFPAEENDASYFDHHDPCEISETELRPVIPLHHLFGSDELSMAAPAVASLAPAPYVALSPSDPLADCDTVFLSFNDETIKVPVKVVKDLPPRAAGIPASVPGMIPGPLPGQCRLSREGQP